jgi:hypothetical protein
MAYWLIKNVLLIRRDWEPLTRKLRIFSILFARKMFQHSTYFIQFLSNFNPANSEQLLWSKLYKLRASHLSEKCSAKTLRRRFQTVSRRESKMPSAHQREAAWNLCYVWTFSSVILQMPWTGERSLKFHYFPRTISMCEYKPLTQVPAMCVYQQRTFTAPAVIC